MKLRWPIPETFAGLLMAVWCVFLYLDYHYSWNIDSGWGFFVVPAVTSAAYLTYKKIYVARISVPADARILETEKRKG